MSQKNIQKQQGNAVFFTMILILAMMALVTAAVKVSSITVQTSDLERNTNNAYTLAQSGIEKINDSITKYIEANSEEITEEVDNAIKKLVFPENQQPNYNYLKYEEEKDEHSKIINTRLIIKPEVQNYYLRKITCEKVLKFFDTEYGLGKNNPKKNLLYNGISDNKLSSTAVTVLSAKLEKPTKDPNKDTRYWGQDDNVGIGLVNQEWLAQDLFTVVVKAEGGNGEIVRAKGSINLQQPKEQASAQTEVIDRYQWVNNPALILDSSIVCFSDFVVQNGARVTVEGDLSVKGTSQETYKDGKLTIVDADQNGGVIVANGGMLDCLKPDNEASNNSNNTGGIYTMNNVMVTNGWLTPGTNVTSQYEANTRINARGDIVADNVVVADDFYMKSSAQPTEIDSENQMPWQENRKVKNTTIQTNGNVFVDNDVRIDRYVSGQQTYIKANGAIFGISDGDMRMHGTGNIDPNKSSGVFNLSEKNLDGKTPMIEAYGIYVNGQPYITFDGESVSSKQYYKLYESIGEPFQDVFGFMKDGIYPYQGSDSKGNPGYLNDDFYNRKINKNCIEITNLVEDKVYAPYTVTANGHSYGDANGEISQDIVHPYFKAEHSVNQEQAKTIFYNKPKHEFEFNISELTKAMPLGEDYNKIIKNPIDYYKGKYGQDGNLGLEHMGHYKKYDVKEPKQGITLEDNLIKYHGIQTLMTAAREVFYGSFRIKDISGDTFDKLEATYTGFENYVKNTGLEKTDWSYNEPFQVITTSETVDIEKYYEGGNPVPTVLYLKGAGNKTILLGNKTSFASNDKKFKGIIICEGDLEIQGSMIIEGSVIVGGNAKGALIRPNVVTGKQAGIYIGTSGSDVKFIHNPQVLLELKFATPKKMRDILDLLGITQYNTVKDKVEEAFKNDGYTQNQIQLSKESNFIHRENMLKGTIKTLKKVDKQEDE